MAAKFVATIDIDHGTTSTRCVLFAADGTPVAMAQRPQTMHYPRPGWVELDMEEVWRRTQECIHAALNSISATTADVAAIGIANERESVVLWDRRTGRPVARSITWQDTRTADAADALAADGGIHRFQRRIGLPISTYSSALKLKWLLDDDADARDGAGRGELLFGTPDTWLLWNLTGGPDGGVHATDPTRRPAVGQEGEQSDRQPQHQPGQPQQRPPVLDPRPAVHACAGEIGVGQQRSGPCRTDQDCRGADAGVDGGGGHTPASPPPAI